MLAIVRKFGFVASYMALVFSISCYANPSKSHHQHLKVQTKNSVTHESKKVQTKVATTTTKKEQTVTTQTISMPVSVKPPAVSLASSYHVFGKKYYVLSSSKNYSQTGIASWYGGSFHGRYTSSGERYNMYQMTAAHKSLPLSTYVLVKNLKNGKSVIVKINDRGPFVSNRLIDLSYGAAKKIGMVGAGVAKVSITALTA